MWLVNFNFLLPFFFASKTIFFQFTFTYILRASNKFATFSTLQLICGLYYYVNKQFSLLFSNPWKFCKRGWNLQRNFSKFSLHTFWSIFVVYWGNKSVAGKIEILKKCVISLSLASFIITHNYYLLIIKNMKIVERYREYGQKYSKHCTFFQEIVLSNWIGYWIVELNEIFVPDHTCWECKNFFESMKSVEQMFTLSFYSSFYL